MKRLVRRESLQRPYSNQIAEIDAFFNYCESSIKGITFHFIARLKIEAKRKALQPRFTQKQIIPGTRSYHCYEPLATNKIGCKCLSSDNEFAGTYSFLNPPKF